jgi:hypothetical protein
MTRPSPFVAVAALLLARPAAADDFAACAAAAEEGQSARDRHALRDARAALVRCGGTDCPEAVRRDCVAWLDDVERRTPTAVFFADAGPGRDLTDVRVLLDGVLVAPRLDGRSVAVDPGEHRVRFVREDGRAEERSVLFVEGEKNRKVEARFADAPRPPVPERAGPSPWAWAAAGVGVAGLAGFTAFGLAGRSDLATLDRCSPRCDPSDVDAARTKYVLADVSLGIAIVGLGVATVLFLTGGPLRHHAR